MTPAEYFCVWLSGRVELQPEVPPSPEEWALICKKLTDATKVHAIRAPLSDEALKKALDKSGKIEPGPGIMPHFPSQPVWLNTPITAS